MPMRSTNPLGYPVAFCSALLFSTESVLAKICYNHGFNIYDLVTMRFLTAVVFFIALAKFVKSRLLPDKSQWKVFLPIIATQIIAIFCLYWAFDLLPPAVAILFFNAYPALTGLFDKFICKNNLGKQQLIALIISAIGLIMLYWSSFAVVSILGMILAVGAALSNAFTFVLMGIYLPKVDHVTYNCTMFFCCILIFGLTGLLTEGLPTDISAKGWLFVIIFGVFTAGAYYTFTYSVVAIGPVDSAIIYLVEPLLAALWAFLLFGDILLPLQALGGIFIIAAAAIPPVWAKIILNKRLNEHIGDVK